MPDKMFRYKYIIYTKYYNNNIFKSICYKLSPTKLYISYKYILISFL